MTGPTLNRRAQRRSTRRAGALAVAATLWLSLSAPASAGREAVPQLGPHSLGTGASAAGSEVCVFCHTPAPGGRAGPVGGTMPGVTFLCLSCHDGSQATDVAMLMSVRGAPASGSGSAAHPVGIPLATGGDDDPGSHRRQRAVIGRETRWWIDTEPVPNGVRDKTDIILYTRVEAGRETPYIECATCHDPHANPDRMFLRQPNARSALCRACHSY